MGITPSGNWTIGGTAIAVERDSRDEEAKHTEIEIIDATTTVIHTAGSKSQRRTIRGMVQGSDIATICGYKNTTQALVSPWGSQGNYYITDVKREDVQDISTTDELARLTLELIKQ